MWQSVKGINLLLILLLLLPATESFARRNKQPLCDIPGMTCQRVKAGQTWESLFPDDYERGIVMRINRTNNQLYKGMVIKVPDDLPLADIFNYSPFPLAIEAPEEKVVVIDLAQNAWGAYDEDGSLVRWGPATGGRDQCSDSDESCRTKEGTFRIYSLGSSNCVSTKFPLPDGGAPMPYCMFFNGGQALHGSPKGVIRGNESHGCVRLYVSDAEWLRYDFVEGPDAYNNYRGTKVIVKPY
jgi:hypothetical protein